MGLKKIIAKITYRDQPTTTTSTRTARGMKVMKDRTQPVQDVSRRGSK